MASAFAYYYIPNGPKMSTVLSRIFAGLFSYLGNFEKIPENCRIKRLHKTAALHKTYRAALSAFFGPERQLSGDLMGGRCRSGRPDRSRRACRSQRRYRPKPRSARGS